MSSTNPSKRFQNADDAKLYLTLITRVNKGGFMQQLLGSQGQVRCVNRAMQRIKINPKPNNLRPHHCQVAAADNADGVGR